MKLIIWLSFAALAMLWTGGAVAMAAALQWAVGLLASGEAATWGENVAAWPVPAWLSFWFDPGAMRAAMEGVVWALDSLQQAQPWIGSVLGWLVPLAWGVWALGMLVLLALAGGAHVLVRRLAPRKVAGAQDGSPGRVVSA